jgi:Putative beta barrel porin-7 (BBP7)
LALQRGRPLARQRHVRLPLTFLGPAPAAGGTGLFVPAGSLITDLDSFRTINNFYGFNFGGQITWDKDWWFINGFTKVAIGPTMQEVIINGNSTFTPPGGATQTAVGGVLALSSNIGTYHRTVVTFVPEIGLNIGLNVLPNLQLTAGYSFLAWTQVVRPGDQISHAINSTEVPTNNTFGTGVPPAAPLFRFVSETFWINSFNVGLNWHF